MKIMGFFLILAFRIKSINLLKSEAFSKSGRESINSKTSDFWETTLAKSFTWVLFFLPFMENLLSLVKSISLYLDILIFTNFSHGIFF